MKTLRFLAAITLAGLASPGQAAPGMSASEQTYFDYLTREQGAHPTIATCIVRTERLLKTDRRYDRLGVTRDELQEGKTWQLRWEKPFSQTNPAIVSSLYIIPGSARLRGSGNWQDVVIRCGWTNQRLLGLEIRKRSPEDK